MGIHIEIGDSITFRKSAALNQEGGEFGKGVVTGYWGDEQWPTVEFGGIDIYPVAPDEIVGFERPAVVVAT
ncbi:hypothetical protein A3709_19520 [Halioglobus sp. HI00S01]|uniref:hypothetical protein n=1 Tax=Halioglobus sp. HI00S01 TaxID=1822214 RepID=UPI0007C3B3B8|nr:hypothetical protein [Halioglobus sp. HI00S01]KZX57815.1 hypothetical protein A3709_19520 [Halioglobus sp. HI00S01]